MSQIGNNLRMLREKRGLTMQDLAEKSGISKSSIYRIENGAQTNITSETIEKLATALGVERSQLEGTTTPAERMLVIEGYGARLTEFRKKRGLSITELAKLIAVDQSTIHRWENEQSKPAQVQIEKLASALETNVGILFPDKNTEKIEPLTHESALRLFQEQHEELMHLRRKILELQKIADTAPRGEDEIAMLEAFRRSKLLLRLFLLRLLTREDKYGERFAEAFSYATPEEKTALSDLLPNARPKS